MLFMTYYQFLSNYAGSGEIMALYSRLYRANLKISKKYYIDFCLKNYRFLNTDNF